MKHVFSLLLLAGSCLAGQTWSQTLPNVELKDIEGNSVETTSLLDHEGPTVFCFWATWCSPCKRELNNYAELYEDWVDETNVRHCRGQH